MTSEAFNELSIADSLKERVKESHPERYYDINEFDEDYDSQAVINNRAKN